MPLTNDDLAQLMAALAETPQFQFLEQLMQSETEPMAGGEDDSFGGEAPPEAGFDDGGGQEDLADVQDVMPSGSQAPVPEENQQPQKNAIQLLPAAAGAAKGLTAGKAMMAGAGGAYLGTKMSRAASGQEPVRYAQLAEAHGQLVKEHGALHAQVEGLLREKADAQRTAAVQELARKHPDFVDVDSELNVVLYSRNASLDDEAFASHVATVEQYAQRAEQLARSYRPDLPSGAVPQPRTEEAVKYEAKLAQEAVKVYTQALNEGKQMTYHEAKQAAAESIKQ